MSDPDLENYLRDNGYPEHIVRDGRPGLIARWRKFVEQVEKGYAFGLEDYRNDLDVRAIIELAGAVDDQVTADGCAISGAAHRDQRARVGIRAQRSVGFSLATASRNAGAELIKGLREEGLLAVSPERAPWRTPSRSTSSPAALSQA